MNAPKSKAQKSTETVVDTIAFSREEAEGWELAPFQRPLTVNDKVRSLGADIAANGGVLPGILTFGNIKGKQFLLDGQHRRRAFLMSEQATGYADVRVCFFETMAEMGEEFVRLNSQLVRLKPDDILRGLEGSVAALLRIRTECPFVGYDSIRRCERSPVVSMALLLRTWAISAPEVPASSCAPANRIVAEMSDADADHLIAFASDCFAAWGRDPEYYRLWSALNLSICAWLYRRTVISPHSAVTKLLDRSAFRKMLVGLSAAGDFLDWLVGRMIGDRDRAPCYTRITAIMSGRYSHDHNGAKYKFPRPAWTLGGRGR